MNHAPLVSGERERILSEKKEAIFVLRRGWREETRSRDEETTICPAFPVLSFVEAWWTEARDSARKFLSSLPDGRFETRWHPLSMTDRRRGFMIVSRRTGTRSERQSTSDLSPSLREKRTSPIRFPSVEEDLRLEGGRRERKGLPLLFSSDGNMSHTNEGHSVFRPSPSFLFSLLPGKVLHPTRLPSFFHDIFLSEFGFRGHDFVPPLRLDRKLFFLFPPPPLLSPLLFPSSSSP